MATDPVMGLCWDIMGRDNPSLVQIKGATSSNVPVEEDKENCGYSDENATLTQDTDTSVACSEQINSSSNHFSSSDVAKLACKKLEEEILQNRKEHKIRMELLQAKREYYVEKTARLMNHL